MFSLPVNLNSLINLYFNVLGTTRNKVALAPGHSLMDWIRLGNSGNDLTGVGGKLLSISRTELAKHNKRTDAWLAIRGTVYNVTQYMDFHPGGVDELVRGIGTDATKLFSEVIKHKKKTDKTKYMYCDNY